MSVRRWRAWGRRDAAAERFPRALAIRERNNTPQNELTDTRFELARSLPDDARAQAIVLAEQLLAGLRPRDRHASAARNRDGVARCASSDLARAMKSRVGREHHCQQCK